MFTVDSHEYNPETNIDTFMLAPLNMKALIKVEERDGADPKVYLGVEPTHMQQGELTEPDWSVCTNKEIIQIALEYYEKRKAEA